MKTITMLLLLAACGQPTDPAQTDATDLDTETETETCAYPEGAAEPMALGQVLTAYSWPTGIHGDGRTEIIDIGKVPCATDEVIDWSPFDALLFVSIPAW